MDILQILSTLRYVNSSLDVYFSDLLPRSITKTCSVIVNSDPHTKGGSHWLAVHFRPKSSYAYYFVSNGIVPFVPDILDFVQRNCATWDRNGRQLQSLTSDVYGKYCCLFALYMDRGCSPQQFVALFGTQQTARLRRFSRTNSALKCLLAAGVNAVAAEYIKCVFWTLTIIPILTWLE